jgi:CheY-like chemotaxis protein
MHAARDPVDILLVEDNPADVVLTREALRDRASRSRLHVVGDAGAALDFLRHRAPYGDAPRPHLLLLDLNLPGRSGYEVLAELKADPELRDIPVVVLTTSGDDLDVRRSYANYANCYIVKPVDFDRFSEVVRSIEAFWFNVVRLPTAH